MESRVGRAASGAEHHSLEAGSWQGKRRRRRCGPKRWGAEKQAACPTLATPGAAAHDTLIAAVAGLYFCRALAGPAHLYGSRSLSRGNTSAGGGGGCDSGMSIHPLPVEAAGASADRTCRSWPQRCRCKGLRGEDPREGISGSRCGAAQTSTRFAGQKHPATEGTLPQSVCGGRAPAKLRAHLPKARLCDDVRPHTTGCTAARCCRWAVVASCTCWPCRALLHGAAMVPDAAVSAAAMPRCRQGGAGAVRHAVKAPGGELWRATAGENNTSMTGLNGEHNWAWCIAPLVWVRVALAVPLFMYSTACRGHVIACEGRADIIVNPSKYSIDTHISLTR